jgi:hypothetical protein
MSANMIASGSKFFILILTITGIIFLFYSAALAGQQGCPCYTASMIDGAFAAAGPEAIRVEGDQTVDFYPSCDDYPTDANAWIDSGPYWFIVFKVSSSSGGVNPYCYWKAGEEEIRIDGISQAQAHACRNEVVRSTVWTLAQCPRGDTN